MALKRITQERVNLQKDPMGTCSAAPESDENLHHWIGAVSGPPSSTYRDGTFNVSIELPEDYPRSAPRLTFATPIFHPNVSSRGETQLADLDRTQWSPVVTIRTILISLQAMMSDPDTFRDYVLNEEAAKLYLKDLEGFEEKARQWTVAHAMLPGKT